MGVYQLNICLKERVYLKIIKPFWGRIVVFLINLINMKCNYCNADIELGTQFCPHCGNKVDNGYVNNENLSWGMKILSLFIPIVGIIYYFMKKEEAPKKAKDAISFGLAGLVLNIIWILGL